MDFAKDVLEIYIYNEYISSMINMKDSGAFNAYIKRLYGPSKTCSLDFFNSTVIEDNYYKEVGLEKRSLLKRARRDLNPRPDA
jgi:hypothetical protein